MPPSDTFFTAPPEWHWLIVLYFFFGGIAGGSFFIAALIDLFGRRRDSALARLGYAVAFAGAVLCPLFLIADLTRPERFWHMLVQSHRGLPMFKYWSPISFGSWILLLFSGFAFLAYLGVLAENGRLRWAPLLALRRGALKPLIAAIGGVLALCFAGYTGVLLTVTNRPIWADTQLLGLLLLVSGATTAAALLLLLSRRSGAIAPDSLRRLSRLETWSSVLELVILAAVVLSLGRVAGVWLSAWGLLLAVGVVLVGILVPLALHWRPGLLGRVSAPASAVMVLIGGFILRAVVVLSAQAV
jgi:formate-dependent nitrite reductase membrane component NrfD